MQPSLVTTFTTAVYTLFDNHGVDLEILGMESSKPYIDSLKAKLKAYAGAAKYPKKLLELLVARETESAEPRRFRVR